MLGRYDADAFETAYDLTQDSAVFFCKGALVRAGSMTWAMRSHRPVGPRSRSLIASGGDAERYRSIYRGAQVARARLSDRTRQREGTPSLNTPAYSLVCDHQHQLNFANTLYRLGRFGDAVPFFDAVLKKDPKHTIASEGRDAALKMQARTWHTAQHTTAHTAHSAHHASHTTVRSISRASVHKCNVTLSPLLTRSA